jgi:hypothetical protein
VYSALWALAEESRPLDLLVKLGNRIRFDSAYNRDPIKQNVQVSDLPELVLVPLGTNESNLHSSSCSSMVTRTYSWIISTGDYRYVELLAPVEWALFCAMANWKNVLLGLTWNGSTFVKDANLIELTDGFSNTENNRGIKGWSSVWNCQVTMYLTTQHLIDFNEG